MSHTARVLRPIARYADLSSTDLLHTILAVEDSVCDLLLAARPDLPVKVALGRAKAHVRSRATHLSNSELDALSSSTASPRVQRHLASNLGVGLQKVAATFDDPRALRTLVNRAFPSSAIKWVPRYDSDTPPVTAVALIALRQMARDGVQVTGLVEAGLLDRAFSAIDVFQPRSPDYDRRPAAEAVAELLAHLACTERDAPGPVLEAWAAHAPTLRTWVPQLLLTSVKDLPSELADLLVGVLCDAEESTRHPGDEDRWKALAAGEPHLSGAMRQRLADLVRDLIGRRMIDSSYHPGSRLAEKLLVDGDPLTWSTIPLDDVLARGEAVAWALPRPVVQVVLGRHDLPSHIAVKIALAFAAPLELSLTWRTFDTAYLTQLLVDRPELVAALIDAHERETLPGQRDGFPPPARPSNSRVEEKTLADLSFEQRHEIAAAAIRTIAHTASSGDRTARNALASKLRRMAKWRFGARVGAGVLEQLPYSFLVALGERDPQVGAWLAHRTSPLFEDPEMREVSLALFTGGSGAPVWARPLAELEQAVRATCLD